ncbi:hypothetical protein PHET_10804, partial [Paragonimus heterotremus]
MSSDFEELHICDDHETVWKESNEAQFIIEREKQDSPSLVDCKSLCMTNGWCVAVIHDSQNLECKLYEKGPRLMKAERNEKTHLRKCLTQQTSEDLTKTPVASTIAFVPPTDSLQDVRFPATTNHCWQFVSTQKGVQIVDRGSPSNPPTRAIQKRVDEYDDNLAVYGMTRDTFATQNSSIFIALTSPNGMAEGTQYLTGLGNEAVMSVLLHRNDLNSGCIKVADTLTVEHPYLRSCLLSASSCEYGITWAIWLQFLSPEMKDKEVLFGTDVRFPATTNHYWQFVNTQIGVQIVDRGSPSNPLTRAIQKRVDEFDDNLAVYGLTRDTFATQNSSIFIALTSPNGTAEGT